MNDIKLLMCCHNRLETVPPLCIPIQCGSAINERLKDAMPDDTGDNISSKNKEYCELTAHYFAWKNLSAEHYGFCHYRRFFSLDETIKRPYVVMGAPKTAIMGDEKHWRSLISSYDMIVPRSEDMGLPVREHYCTSRFHYAEDLALFLELIKTTVPKLYPFAEEYLSQRRQYFCNMFIMDKAHFNEYCSMLFPLLSAFDEKKTLHGSFQADRTDGYLGELFTGIYISFCRANGARIKELPRVDICCKAAKRIAYYILPPESKLRFAAKRIAKRLRKQRI